jgi:hypothetical protein
MIDFTPPEPTHLCTNTDCHDREWNLVRLSRGLWRLRSSRGVFTMGASQPACPRCGAPLLEIAAIQPDPESDRSEEARTLETPRVGGKPFVPEASRQR